MNFVVRPSGLSSALRGNVFLSVRQRDDNSFANPCLYLPRPCPLGTLRPFGAWSEPTPPGQLEEISLIIAQRTLFYALSSWIE
jgi:hypothetical protein